VRQEDKWEALEWKAEDLETPKVQIVGVDEPQEVAREEAKKESEGIEVAAGLFSEKVEKTPEEDLLAGLSFEKVEKTPEEDPWSDLFSATAEQAPREDAGESLAWKAEDSETQKVQIAGAHEPRGVTREEAKEGSEGLEVAAAPEGMQTEETSAWVKENALEAEEKFMKVVAKEEASDGVAFDEQLEDASDRWFNVEAEEVEEASNGNDLEIPEDWSPDQLSVEKIAEVSPGVMNEEALNDVEEELNLHVEAVMEGSDLEGSDLEEMMNRVNEDVSVMMDSRHFNDATKKAGIDRLDATLQQMLQEVVQEETIQEVQAVQEESIQEEAVQEQEEHIQVQEDSDRLATLETIVANHMTATLERAESTDGWEVKDVLFYADEWLDALMDQHDIGDQVREATTKHVNDKLGTGLEELHKKNLPIPALDATQRLEMEEEIAEYMTTLVVEDEDVSTRIGSADVVLKEIFTKYGVDSDTETEWIAATNAMLHEKFDAKEERNGFLSLVDSLAGKVVGVVHVVGSKVNEISENFHAHQKKSDLLKAELVKGMDDIVENHTEEEVEDESSK